MKETTRLVVTRMRFFSEQTLLALGLAVLGALLVVMNYLWEWDQVIYDLLIKGWQRPAPEDVVIVAIDQASLNELGRWPWSRRLHAGLLDRLRDYQSGPVLMDIIFSEPAADRAGDRRLIEAVADHGQVALPVVFERLGQGKLFTELLPFPPLDAQAKLGHADMDIDRDGIARSIYLQAGVDGAYWPALAVALLRLTDADALAELPGRRAAADDNRAAPQTTLVRDHQIWIPFAGPPGHFRSVSFADVLYGRVAEEALRDKIVLAGFTAVGLDVLPTPVSAERRPMPGVEIHANVFDTLRQQLWIVPLAQPWQIALTVLFALLPLLLYPRLSPRLAPLAALLALTPPLLASLLLLRVNQLWFPPSAAVLVVVLGYVLWSWRRLHTTLRYLNQELEQLNREPSVLPSNTVAPPTLTPVLEFLRHTLPVQGCVLRHPQSGAEQSWGQPPAAPTESIKTADGWRRDEAQNSWWLALPSSQGSWQLGVRWQPGADLSAAQRTLIDDLIKPYLLRRSGRPVTPVEILQDRIQQVQQASERLRTMRNFITDSLAQMADGVLVTDSLGQVLLHNPKAALYLAGDPEATLNRRNLAELFVELEFVGTPGWQQSLSAVLIDRQLVQLPARAATGHDLLVHMAPFADERNLWRGLVVNFADVSPLRASERRRAEMLNFLSHDLRSPLASVMALTQLAKYKPEQLVSGRITAQIEDRARATLGLVDDFLQLARAESSDELELDELDVVPLVEEATEQVRPQADDKGSLLTVDLGCEEAWLRGNAGLLRRMFNNLLSNAIKYSPSGSRITLSVSISAVDNEVCCRVKDNGYGIAAEHLDTLFDRFQRIHREEHKKEQGTGLGLAFVKTVVVRHQGRIAVHSELNRGSEFIVHFPLLTAELQARDEAGA